MGTVIPFKSKNKAKEDRTPLYVDSLSGKIKGRLEAHRFQDDDSDARMQRIKASLEKINELMKEKKSTKGKKDEYEY